MGVNRYMETVPFNMVDANYRVEMLSVFVRIDRLQSVAAAIIRIVCCTALNFI